MDYKKPQSTIVQGGVGLYPLTTADQVILADGSRLEKDGKISADSAADSAKLGGKAPEYYIQPRNLLDNSDFRNPVNQRVYTVYNTLGYTIDRWLLYFSDWANFTVGDGLVFNASSNGCSFYQRIAANAVKVGAKYTLAYMLDGDVYAQERIFEATENESYDVAIIIPEGTHTLLWAALYEGSYTADTLPPYVPKGYAAELAECQRYYYQSWTDGSANTFNGVIIREAIALSRTTNVVFPQTMRISNPTVTLYSPSTGNTGKASEFVSDTEIDVGSVYLSRNGFALSSTASAFEIGKHYCIHYSVSADL